MPRSTRFQVTGTCAQHFGNGYVGIVWDAQDGRNMLLVIVLFVCDTQVRSGLCFCLWFTLWDPKASSQVKKQCKNPEVTMPTKSCENIDDSHAGIFFTSGSVGAR